MAIYELDGYVPTIAATAYVAEGATVIGRVTLGEHASVWPGAVIRADDDTISIGARSNIQDGAVLHVDPGLPMTIGTDVTVGHLATLHGCTIGDGALIGLGAIVYNRAVIGRDAQSSARGCTRRFNAFAYTAALSRGMIAMPRFAATLRLAASNVDTWMREWIERPARAA